MSRPIPRRLLVHSGTLKHRTGVDQYNKPTYAADVALTNVRFEPVKATALQALGEMKDDKMLMFFDCVNSSPVGTTFAQMDRIVFGDLTLTVRMVEPVYGDSAAVHHYEVSLT